MSFDTSSFMLAASRVGVENPEFLAWSSANCADQLLVGAKACARVCGRAFGVPHRAALERIARSVGYGSWHAMQRTLTAPDDQRAWPVCCAVPPAALPLLINVPLDLPADHGKQLGLVELASRLAEPFGVGVSQLLDALSKWQGAADWHSLCSRLPIATQRPLYSFHEDAEGHGAVVASTPCLALSEDLSAWLDEAEADDAAALIEHLATVVRARPDFLDAFVSLGESFVQHGSWNEALNTYSRALTAAHKIVPEGFSGPLHWRRHQNRVYLRLLWGHMHCAARAGYLHEALELTKRLCQLNPYPLDVLGIRYVFPVFLCLAGEGTEAAKAIRSLREVESDRSPQGHFILALTSWLLGDRLSATRGFLAALFRYPGYRPLLLNDEVLDPLERPELSRGVIPDTSLSSMLFGQVVHFDPHLATFVRDIFSDERVTAIEMLLARIYQEGRAAGLPHDLSGWQLACNEALEQLRLTQM